MKNIYFYIYPEQKFAPEYVAMSQAQIDNSLLYWRPEDILVVTNFDWQYKGVRSLVVSDQLNARVQSHGTSLSNKPLTAIYLIENNLVNEINWFHDWDIWQLGPLNLPPLDRDIGFVEYSYQPKIQLGSIFFKPSALDIFGWIANGINRYKTNEEETTNILINQNYHNILERFQILDNSYNIGPKNLRTAISFAEKPLKIAHFPPYKRRYLDKARTITPPDLANILDQKFGNKPKIKNLMVYISPKKQFNPEHAKMIEVQVDNSLNYWNSQDIILLTNFEFEYKGVKAIVGPDNLINKTYSINKRAIINSKVNAIIYLLENKIINDLTWFHDFDAFQLAPLEISSLDADIGVTCYGQYPESQLTNLGKRYKNRINFGSVFFKPESLDIFKKLLSKMDETGLYEEDAMTVMLDVDKNIASRVKIMNQTFNIGMRYTRTNMALADKPIKVAHFPPHDPRILHKFKSIIPDKLSKMLDEKFTNLS